MAEKSRCRKGLILKILLYCLIEMIVLGYHFGSHISFAAYISMTFIASCIVNVLIHLNCQGKEAYKGSRRLIGIILALTEIFLLSSASTSNACLWSSVVLPMVLMLFSVYEYRIKHRATSHF